ncbi:hypothetical protein F4823DRAFT_631753 [Ustulina deusta]|nr:hypothetical protein F4823DRAFT_631753 [Ustulina deusta]
MEAGRQYNPIYWIRGWFGPQQAPQVNPDHQLVSFDPNFAEVVPKDFVTQARQNHAELCHIKDALDKKTKECDQFREHWQTSALKLAELRDIEKALNEKIEECDKIREHWQAAVGELSDLKSSKRTFMVDDAEMTAKWKKLQYAIKNLAIYLCHAISLKQLTKDQEKSLESVTPLYRELLSTEGQVHLLFQSLVWIQITDRILRNPTVVWGANVSAAAKTVFQFGLNPVEDYHAWRAQTAQIIQNGRGISNSQKKSLEITLCSTMAYFIPENTLSTEKQRVIVHRVVEIIDKAIELAAIFNQSVCDYKIIGVAHGHCFSPTMMEYYDECEAPAVDLMISPALIKHGNSMGKDYDQWLVLAKSYVWSSDQHAQKDGNDEEKLIQL